MNRSTSESKFHPKLKKKKPLVKSAVKFVISPQQKLPMDGQQREIQIKTKEQVRALGCSAVLFYSLPACTPAAAASVLSPVRLGYLLVRVRSSNQPWGGILLPALAAFPPPPSSPLCSEMFCLKKGLRIFPLLHENPSQSTRQQHATKAIGHTVWLITWIIGYSE